MATGNPGPAEGTLREAPPALITAGGAVWATVTAVMCSEKESPALKPTPRTARMDVRVLLAGLTPSEVLTMLTPDRLLLVSINLAIDKFLRADWCPAGELLKEVMQSAQPPDHPVTFDVPFLDREPEDISAVTIRVDDAHQAWTWATDYAWHRVVAAASQILVTGGVADVVDRLPALAERTPLGTQCWEAVHHLTPVYLEYAAQRRSPPRRGKTAEEEAKEHRQRKACNSVSWHASRLVGPVHGGPLMNFDRAVAYLNAGVSVGESRLLEFGSPENRPTEDALHAMAALRA